MMVYTGPSPRATVAPWLGLDGGLSAAQGMARSRMRLHLLQGLVCIGSPSSFPLCDDPANPAMSGRGNDGDQDKCLTSGSIPFV